MEYISAVSELNYLTQIVIMLYEDPTKDMTSEERYKRLHFIIVVRISYPSGLSDLYGLLL